MRALPVAALLVCVALFAGCLGGDPATRDPVTDEDGRPLGRQVRLVKVAEGLDDPVWVTGAGDGSGRLFILEQVGRVRVVEDGVLREAPYLDLTDRVGSGGSEQGLLGLAFPPGFENGGAIIVSYNDRQGDSVLARFATAADGSGADPASEEVLLRVEQPYSNHNGGQVSYGPDGYVWWALGDGGAGGDPHENGQNPDTLLGSILRLDVVAGGGGDAPYAIPPDNPFADGAGGRPEVYVYGLRNPWRFSFDTDGGLWIGDVGQSAVEEIDRLPAGQQAGANLGWNAFEGSETFDQARAEEVQDEVVFPVAEYARRAPHCSVTGGYVYRGAEVPALQGHYVFADYCSGWVWTLHEEDGDWAMGLLFRSERRVSSFGVDDAGSLYLIDHQGTVLRFEAV